MVRGRRTSMSGSMRFTAARRVFWLDCRLGEFRAGGPTPVFLLRWPVSPSSAGCLRWVRRGGVCLLLLSGVGELAVLGASLAPPLSLVVGTGSSVWSCHRGGFRDAAVCVPFFGLSELRQHVLVLPRVLQPLAVALYWVICATFPLYSLAVSPCWYCLISRFAIRCCAPFFFFFFPFPPPLPPPARTGLGRYGGGGLRRGGGEEGGGDAGCS
jgi:hypothetical protein